MSISFTGIKKITEWNFNLEDFESDVTVLTACLFARLRIVVSNYSNKVCGQDVFETYVKSLVMTRSYRIQRRWHFLTSTEDGDINNMIPVSVCTDWISDRKASTETIYEKIRQDTQRMQYDFFWRLRSQCQSFRIRLLSTNGHVIDDLDAKNDYIDFDARKNSSACDRSISLNFHSDLVIERRTRGKEIIRNEINTAIR